MIISFTPCGVFWDCLTVEINPRSLIGAAPSPLRRFFITACSCSFCLVVVFPPALIGPTETSIILLASFASWSTFRFFPSTRDRNFCPLPGFQASSLEAISLARVTGSGAVTLPFFCISAKRAGSAFCVRSAMRISSTVP